MFAERRVNVHFGAGWPCGWKANESLRRADGSMRVLNGTATALGPCPSRPRYAPTGGIDGDKPAHGFLMEQDREIAEKSGRPPAKITSITRSGAKQKVRDYSERRAG